VKIEPLSAEDGTYAGVRGAALVVIGGRSTGAWRRSSRASTSRR
jgi:hypothetical protein